MMRRSVHFLSSNSRAHVTNVANMATRALTVEKSKWTTISKALMAKLQAMDANSTVNATNVVNKHGHKKEECRKRVTEMATSALDKQQDARVGADNEDYESYDELGFMT